MWLEPPRESLRGRPDPALSTASIAPDRRALIATARRLHLALVGAAALLALTSSGDLFFLAALLALVAVDPMIAGAVSLSVTAVIVRFGSSSLATVAGAQGVLGPAVLLGNPASALAMALAGLAVAMASPRGLPVLAFGLTAGALWSGAAPGDWRDVAVRIIGSVVGLAVAWGAARYLPRRPARIAAVGLSAAAVALAAAGRLI